MIKLFDSSATVFTSMGLGSLHEATSCEVHEVGNGEFTLEMSYPLNGLRYSDITLGRLIFCKPNPYDEPQAFRIYSISEPENGEIDISAEHISYDLNGIVAAAFSGENPADTMADLKEATAYTGYTCPFNLRAKMEQLDDKDTETDWTIPKMSFETDIPDTVRSILGGSDSSILSTYGGEFKFDNYDVTLYKTRGKNRGVSVRYGKNIETITQDKTNTDIYSHIYPYWTSSNSDHQSSYYHVWVNNEVYYDSYSDADNARNALNEGYKSNVKIVREMKATETSYKYKLYYGEYDTLTDANALIQEWWSNDSTQSLGVKNGEAFYVGHGKQFTSKTYAETYISDVLDKCGYAAYVYQLTSSIYEVYTGNYSQYSDASSTCESLITDSQNFPAEYNSSTTYNSGDYCCRTSNEVSIVYKCNTDGTTGTWDANKWYEDPKPSSSNAYVTTLPVSTETGTQVVTLTEKVVPIGEITHSVSISGTSTSEGIYVGTYSVSFTITNHYASAYTTINELSTVIGESILPATGTLVTSDETFTVAGVTQWMDSGGNLVIALTDSGQSKLALTGTTADSIVDTVTGSANTLGFYKVLPLDFSSEFDTAPAESVLRSYAEKSAKNLSTEPEVTFDISFLDLSKTAEYGNVALLQTVMIGDTVNLYFPSRNINKTAKCIQTDYNVLTDRYTSITISTEEDPVPKTISETISDQSVKLADVSTTEETKEHVSTYVEDYVLKATNAITGNAGGYIITLTNEDGNPYEFLIMDTQDISTAQNVWRWNSAGLAHSSTGYGGPYTMGMYADGSINADLIVVGKIKADLLEAHSITSDHISLSYTEGIDTKIESKIDITKESIMAKFRETAFGGINRLLNSSGRNDLTHWEVSSGSTIVAEANPNPSAGYMFHLTSGSMYQTLNDLTPDTDYCLSFMWFAAVSNGQFTISIKDTNGTTIKDLWSYTDEYSSSWGFKSVIFTTPNANVTFHISSTTDFYIADLMLTKGSVIESWTPAPNEIYTQDVIIDKDGVTVSNEETQTKTNINSREFAIYNNNSKVLTVNKDVTELQKTVVNGEATLNKFQFVSTGDTTSGATVAYINILD